MSSVLTTRERPDAPDASSLVRKLEDHLASRYPTESRHGFSVERLLAEGVHFGPYTDDPLNPCYEKRFGIDQ